MISGAHTVLYSANAEADRAFLRDILKLSHVDAGDGWLIFALPPSEIAVHPAETNDGSEVYLLADDIKGFVAKMRSLRVPCTDVADRGWGLVTSITLPGGGSVGVYEPRHARPSAAR